MLALRQLRSRFPFSRESYTMASTSTFNSLVPSKRPREASLDTLATPLISSPRPATSQRFRDSIVLAPMVRSGTMPTRLLALKYGASLVWGPEIVDKAMLHAKRVVDAKTGIVSYEGVTSSIWSCHPAERPYLIYQIGSSTPSLAVAAALLVSRDVSGVDLNCGCPKPFSTSGGMGAALLDTPEVLCEILTSLRKALPPYISVSCKIRLLPDQEKTLDLVRRIVRTGISCLTVHCRTRNMRNGDRAVIERLKDIVDCVRSMRNEDGTPLDVAILANGDVEGWRDMQRVREITGADGVMVATKAEENPSCFAEEMANVEDLVVQYLKIAKYTSHNFANAKHCISSFKSAPGITNQKAALKALRGIIAPAKDYLALKSLVQTHRSNGTVASEFNVDTWGGDEEIHRIVNSIKARPSPTWWEGVEKWEEASQLKAGHDGMDLGEEGIKKLLEREKEERPRKKSKLDKGEMTVALSGTRSGEGSQLTPLHTSNPDPSVNATPGPLFVSYVPPLIAGGNERSPSPERPIRTAALAG